MGKCKCCCRPGPRGPPGNAEDVTWRPYYSGPPQTNLVPTPGASGWNEVVRLLSNSVGPRTLYLDPTDVVEQTPTPTTPFLVPPGSYDLTNVMLRVSSQWNPVVTLGDPTFFLVIQDGATFTNLLTMEGPFAIDYQGTTVPCVVIDVADLRTNVHLRFGSGVICSGSQPMWQFIDPSASGLKGTIVLETGGIVAFDSNYVVENVDTDVSIFIMDYSILGDGVLSSTLMGEYQIVINAFFAANTTVQLGFTIPFIQGAGGSQPEALGPVTITDASLRAKVVSESGIPTAMDDISRGFKIGDMWIDGADVYVRTGTGATGWVLVS